MVLISVRGWIEPQTIVLYWDKGKNYYSSNFDILSSL